MSTFGLLNSVVLAAYLAGMVMIGLWFSRRQRSAEDYFLAGRSLPGWLVGLSIVATTFAADTPLAISGMVASKGIAANWFWWSMGVAHVGVVLFWAPLWRRARVVTDAEFVELRYGGRAGRHLRVFKALFFAILFNGIVLGWVLRAMQKIAQPFARWEQWLPSGVYDGLASVWNPNTALGGVDEAITVVLLVGLATTYSTLGGLRGVVWTDLAQFGLALLGSFGLAWVVVHNLGAPWTWEPRLQAAVGGSASLDEVLAFAPLDGDLTYLSLKAFAVYLFLRWWAHPMADGGGYLAQRMSAARSPKDAQVAAGTFLFLHYVVRPWPWVLVGLAGLIFFPPGAETSLFASGTWVAADREMAYPVLAGEVLPAGLLGVLLASLLAAFMSTVDTHLNWGVSYIAHDLWKGRLRPLCSEREVVRVGRIASVLFAVLALGVAAHIDSVEKAWKAVAAVGAGLGLPVVLRWLWWRVNAQAEWAGSLASLVVGGGLILWEPGWAYEMSLAAAVVAGAVAALLAMWLAPPPEEEVLDRFYRRVRPPGLWGPVRARLIAQAGSAAAPGEGSSLAAFDAEGEERPLELWRLALAWFCGAVALLSAIFVPGHLLLGRWVLGISCLLLSGLGGLAALRLAGTTSPPSGRIKHRDGDRT